MEGEDGFYLSVNTVSFFNLHFYETNFPQCLLYFALFFIKQLTAISERTCFCPLVHCDTSEWVKNVRLNKVEITVKPSWFRSPAYHISMVYHGPSRPVWAAKGEGYCFRISFNRHILKWRYVTTWDGDVSWRDDCDKVCKVLFAEQWVESETSRTVALRFRRRVVTGHKASTGVTFIFVLTWSSHPSCLN